MMPAQSRVSDQASRETRLLAGHPARSTGGPAL